MHWTRDCASPRWRAGADFHLFGGCGAFVQTPMLAWDMITNRGDDVLGGTIAMGAWLTNFTVFLKLPARLGLAVTVLPWIAYVWFFLILAGFIPFYFWAVGLALIHGS